MQKAKSSFWIGLTKKSSGKLDDVERISEVIFGLIMVLTFTCTMSAATSGREEVGTILWAALGCNVAWGIIDAFIYLFTVLMYRGESLDAIHGVRNSGTDEEANDIIRDEFPTLFRNLMKKEHYDYLRAELKKLPEPPSKTLFTWNDVFGAFKIFFLVFLSTFPVVIPFFFVQNVIQATRISNTIALMLLFATGYYFGKRTRFKPLRTAFVLTGIGAVLVAITIALGG